MSICKSTYVYIQTYVKKTDIRPGLPSRRHVFPTRQRASPSAVAPPLHPPPLAPAALRAPDAPGGRNHWSIFTSTRRTIRCTSSASLSTCPSRPWSSSRTWGTQPPVNSYVCLDMNETATSYASPPTAYSCPPSSTRTYRGTSLMRNSVPP